MKLNSQTVTGDDDTCLLKHIIDKDVMHSNVDLYLFTNLLNCMEILFRQVPYSSNRTYFQP